MAIKDTKQSEVSELDAADNERYDLAPRRTNKSLSQGAMIGIAAAVAIATGIVGFVGGMQYQKGSSSATTSNQQNGFDGQSGFRGMNMNGSFGEVTAVSDSSITISVRQGGPNSSSSSSATKTYTITSSTTITNNGSAGSLSDIATGDTVMIEADSSDSSVAASIRVGMGGMPGGRTQSAITDSTSTET